MLLIYTIQSYGEKEKILNETDKFNNQFTFEEFPYHAKNSLIVFKPSEMPKVEEDLESIGKTASLISSIVFEDLNKGKERVYKGDSENGKGPIPISITSIGTKIKRDFITKVMKRIAL